jgi:hypothetical protein
VVILRASVVGINVSVGPAILSKGREKIVVDWIKGESLEHWILKVAGVVELLRQGFRGSEIEIEKVFTKGKTKCRADLYAEHVKKGRRRCIWLECEPYLNFKEKINDIRNVFSGRVAFLIDFEGWNDLISSARDHENPHYAFRRLIPQNTEVWTVHFGEVPKVIFGIRHQGSEIILLEGDWSVKYRFRKCEYDKIESLKV